MPSSAAASETPNRAWLTGLPIAAWLVLAFAFVIGAFAVATGVALQSTREATAGLGRMQQEFEPLSLGQAEFAARLKADHARWGPVVKATGYSAGD